MLLTNGFLFLGNSESIGSEIKLFAAVDKKRVFIAPKTFHAEQRAYRCCHSTYRCTTLQRRKRN